MKSKALITVIGITVLIGLNFIFTKRISSWLLSSKTESLHFVIHSRPSDSNLANQLQSIFEKDYERLKGHYKVDLESKIAVNLFTSNHLYNMTFGNPFPFPKSINNYAGQTIGNKTYVLIPKKWKSEPDTIFPPDLTRTIVAHEMTHAFVFQINPDIKGWVTEGIAKYEETAFFNDLNRKHGFANWIGQDIKEGKIPKFTELFAGHKITSAEITFDYLFAGSFIDFAVTSYGYQKVLVFIKTNDFKTAFGNSEDEIWIKWVEFLNERYQV
jgi:hypothetical protein